MQQNFAMPLGLDFKAINAQVAAWKAEAAKRPPTPKPVRVCTTAAEMRNYREEFFYGTDWSQKLSDATEAEFALEQKIAGYNSTVARCQGPKSDLTAQQRRDILQRIIGYDFPTSATRHHEHPTMEHFDGLLDRANIELAEIRRKMPHLVRSAQTYLDELKHVPTEAQILEARRREREVEELVR